MNNLTCNGGKGYCICLLKVLHWASTKSLLTHLCFIKMTYLEVFPWKHCPMSCIVMSCMLRCHTSPLPSCSMCISKQYPPLSPPALRCSPAAATLLIRHKPHQQLSDAIWQTVLSNVCHNFLCPPPPSHLLSVFDMNHLIAWLANSG